MNVSDLDRGWLVTNVQAGLDRAGLDQLDAAADPELLERLEEHALQSLDASGDVDPEHRGYVAVDRIVAALAAIYFDHGVEPLNLDARPVATSAATRRRSVSEPTSSYASRARPNEMPRTILVHLNVEPAAGDQRNADEIGDAILAALEVGLDGEPGDLASGNTLEVASDGAKVAVALCEEV